MPNNMLNTNSQTKPEKLLHHFFIFTCNASNSFSPCSCSSFFNNSFLMTSNSASFCSYCLCSKWFIFLTSSASWSKPSSWVLCSFNLNTTFLRSCSNSFRKSHVSESTHLKKLQSCDVCNLNRSKSNNDYNNKNDNVMLPYPSNLAPEVPMAWIF